MPPQRISYFREQELVSSHYKPELWYIRRKYYTFPIWISYFMPMVSNIIAKYFYYNGMVIRTWMRSNNFRVVTSKESMQLPAKSN